LKRILFLLVGLCSLLTACNNPEPDIQVDTIISNITAEEFDDLGGTQEYGEATEKDFKKLTFDFSMEHNEKVERKIEMFNDWRTLLNEYDGFERYWGGESSSQDNIEEDFAKYHYELIFFTKGLSEAEIRGIFKEATIHVEWKDVEGTESLEYDSTYARDYIIGNVIKFK